MKLHQVLGFSVFVFAFSAVAHADVQANCVFVSATTFSNQVSVEISCDGNLATLMRGTDNSPCKAATQLGAFVAGMQPGDRLSLIAHSLRTSTIDGASRENLQVMSGTRAGSDLKLETPSVIRHGKPVLCSSTHIDLF